MNEEDIYNRVHRTRLNVELDVLQELEVDAAALDHPCDIKELIHAYIGQRRDELKRA